MIKLFKVKEKQKEANENGNGKGPCNKQTAGELRLHKGFDILFLLDIYSSIVFLQHNFVWSVFYSVEN